MRRQSNSLGLVAVVAALGLVATAPSVGCGGDAAQTSSGSGSGASGGAGGSGDTGGAGGAGGIMAVCGNGKMEDLEACDDGNTVDGDGCQSDCSFTCNNVSPATGDAKCDDKDPCNGAEKCQDDHTCSVGTPAADGTECGTGKFCNAGICIDDSCGDGFTSPSEECDDGNLVNGDGCDSCKFSCVAADPARDCTSNDVCVGQLCDDATHTCGPAILDGKACGKDPLASCVASVCTSSCGNGTTDAGEDCDDGNLATGDGCEPVTCKFSCASPAADCPAASACSVAACDAAHTCTTQIDASQNGTKCDPQNPTFVCKDGSCAAPAAVCGNGTLEAGEQCDFGANNGAGSGCETTCSFSCNADADCADAETCNGAETCIPVVVGGQSGKQCKAGTNLANCTPCQGGLCGSGVCKASTCGDTCIDMNAGEQCEPPGAAGCDAMCKFLPVCGNGLREAGEQCDDGNTTNIDGCDSVCMFEQVQRVNWLQMQFGVDAAFCPQNALGGSIKSLAQGTLQTSLDTGVQSGSISIMFKVLGLDDLSGTSDPAIELGVLNADPVVAPMGVTYDGTASPDWWYTVDMLSLDASRTPTDKLAGSINAKVVTAGPGTLTLNVLLADQPAVLRLNNGRLTVLDGATNTPATSAGATPGHLASEQLDPALTSFATAGQPTAAGAGKLCGNVTAASLATVPIPAALAQGGGISACSQNYPTTASLLDVIVGGCTVLFGQTAIAATQPDQVDTNLPPLGAGGLYKLSASNAMTKAVDTCKDKNGAVQPLASCLKTAEYSSFFKFTTNRVIAK